jgi:YD repeat-containing protein
MPNTCHNIVLYDAMKRYVSTAIALVARRVAHQASKFHDAEEAFFFTRLGMTDDLQRLPEYQTCLEALLSDQAASNHPGSFGGYSAQNTIYDLTGLAAKQSNPAETSDSWNFYGDDSAGWLYTQQTYDWKGRPLVTTNPDGTTKEASYGGCGCAGGEVLTLTDEGTIDDGVTKRRQQKIYSDVLGRSVKRDVLNWQGGSVYSTTIKTYNGRDQITWVRQFDAANATIPEDPNDLSCPTGTCQQTTMTYDGYGRLKTKHLPQQDDDAATTYNYNVDDTVLSVTDPRGASQTLGYNNRHLVTSITYSAPEGITPPSNVTYSYDAAGNRSSMTDGMGSISYLYDQLSRLTSETRSFAGLGTFPLTYAYNLGDELTRVTDPFGAQVSYNFDNAGSCREPVDTCLIESLTGGWVHP